MPSSPRRRTALSHVGGPTQRGGDPSAAAVLADALAAAEHEPDDAFTHGFHTYTARMHPAIAAGVLRAWAGEGTRVLDPFCGGGTVLLEAMRLGARVTGVDLNPIARRIAQVRLERRSEAQIRRFETTAARVVEASLRRVKARTPSRAPLRGSERQHWAPHVLLELAGLWEEIETVTPVPDRHALQMVLSAIVVKFSNQRADASEEQVERQVGKGVPSRFFGKKASELAERWRALGAELPRDVPAPRLVEGDVRDLAALVGDREPYELVLSSPPYGGTYDYVDHHARRYSWLALSPKRLAERELGARRRYARADTGAASRWDDEVRAMLRSIAEVLAPDGGAVLLVGDGQVGERRIDARAQLQRLAPDAGLRVTAWASQPRPDFRGGDPRAEHLVLLVRG